MAAEQIKQMLVLVSPGLISVERRHNFPAIEANSLLHKVCFGWWGTKTY
ncbi:MAG: hypothetical protein ACLRXQ_11545 [Phascolarctobacterium faecium]